MREDEDSPQNEGERRQVLSMADVLWKFPLFDNLFLSMQGQNVMFVDFHLRELETDLLRAYIESERTPFPDILYVSALSQMWVFAVYELLRTWRQFVRELKSGIKAVADDEADLSSPPNLAALYRRQHMQEYQASEKFRMVIDAAWQSIEPVFRRIEALRMNLAKHEVPKPKGEPAFAPGYGRIDYSDGSIYWFVDLGNGYVDQVSRRTISDDLRRVVIGRTLDE